MDRITGFGNKKFKTKFEKPCGSRFDSSWARYEENPMVLLTVTSPSLFR